MLVIPSVDIKDGKCVKLIQGKPGSGAVISNDPVQIAKRWEKEGAKILHVIDLDGAFTGKRKNWPIVAKLLKGVNMPVQVGGGIRNLDEALETLDAGAQWAIIGTTAIEDPSFMLGLVKFVDPSQLIIALDSRRGKVLKHGWTAESEESPTELAERYQRFNIAAYLYTEVEAEGRVEGVNIQSVKSLVSSTKIPVIYSGGISSLQDLKELMQAGAYGAVIGSALYKGVFSLKEAELAVEKKGS